MIVQLSTGGRSGRRRRPAAAMLSLRPDMASLAVGSNNFPTRVYENAPDLVDWLAAEMVSPWTSSPRSRPSTSRTSCKAHEHVAADGQMRERRFTCSSSWV
jgi:hypothetical protein